MIFLNKLNDISHFFCKYSVSVLSNYYVIIYCQLKTILIMKIMKKIETHWL